MTAEALRTTDADAAEPLQSRKDKYAILHEHRRTDGSFKSIEELEMEYVQLTDKLIYKMTHGETVAGSEAGGEKIIPTKVVFLDKSARPLAWLVNELWDVLAPEPGSDEIPPKPDFKFLNIDRKQWVGEMDPNGTGGYDARHISQEAIEGLRSIYNRKHDGSYDAENEMDDQAIMVVDEVRSTGRTLDISRQIIQRAFPGSKVFGTHWMGGRVSVPGGDANADLPVWYRDDSTNVKHVYGRGVGNRAANPTHPSQLFLSTRFPEPDQRALRLREDLKELAEGVKSGEVPYVPDFSREIDDMEKRSERINGRPLKEVVLARRAIKNADAEK